MSVAIWKKQEPGYIHKHTHVNIVDKKENDKDL